jgi:diguanylate cyclase (GGDEF)-like protein
MSTAPTDVRAAVQYRQVAADERVVMGASSHQRADTVARLTGLLEVTRLVRSERDLDALLPAVAAAISQGMEFRTVVISVYRPAWNDFRVETVHGSDEGRETLLGRERTWAQWEPLFDLKFERHGCFFLPWDEYDWSWDTTVSFVPEIEMADGPDAWHAEDAIFVPMRHSQGHVLGIMSVDEPTSGRRPTDDDLAVLGALAAHAAQAVQDAQAAVQAERHRTALEQLLRVSARLTETLSIDAILQSVCEGIRTALGFHNVSVELIDEAGERAVPRAVVGWTPDEVAASQSGDVEVLRRLLDPEFEVEGCFLLPSREACARLGIERPVYESTRNGRGPLGWNHHWLLIPLSDRHGRLLGVIWADEPEDRLLPSTERLQALRMFANQATTAVASVAAYEEMQFLADHDPLTRVGNRRAFTRRLAEEVHRAARYDQRFALVVLDVDGFKGLNDRHGHLAGDVALEAIGDVLRETLRRSDCAFRLGGDEFALILEETGAAEATLVVDRIGAGIASVEAGAGHMLRASFGVALGEGPVDPEALLQAADTAMYEAKRAGEGVRFATVTAD